MNRLLLVFVADLCSVHDVQPCIQPCIIDDDQMKKFNTFNKLNFNLS